MDAAVSRIVSPLRCCQLIACLLSASLLSSHRIRIVNPVRSQRIDFYHSVRALASSRSTAVLSIAASFTYARTIKLANCICFLTVGYSEPHGNGMEGA
jgi:hypothetical protein